MGYATESGKQAIQFCFDNLVAFAGASQVGVGILAILIATGRTVAMLKVAPIGNTLAFSFLRFKRPQPKTVKWKKNGGQMAA